MPRIDWWIIMISLSLSWRWMTHEEINNNQKTRRAEEEEGEQERDAVAGCYTHSTHTINATEFCYQSLFCLNNALKSLSLNS